MACVVMFRDARVSTPALNPGRPSGNKNVGLGGSYGREMNLRDGFCGTIRSSGASAALSSLNSDAGAEVEGWPGYSSYAGTLPSADVVSSDLSCDSAACAAGDGGAAAP